MMDPTKIRLLLVSNDEADAILIANRLKEIPCTSLEWIRSVEGGIFALGRGEHDLCLLDSELGARGGFKLLERHGDAIPIIVLGRGENGDGAHPIPARAFDVLDRAHVAGPLFERTLRYALERRSMAGSMAGMETRPHLDAQARLMLADRLARGSVLAASVAHEINNPLAYVTSNLVFAIDELGRLAASLPHTPECGARLDQVREALADARQGAERVEAITRDLKIFSQARDDRKGTVDVHRILKVALNMTGAEIRARARLVTDLGPIPDVIANDGRLAHVFINLLLNAAQAIPEGKPRDHTVHVATRMEHEGVIIEVSDTGTGMPHQVLERVFEPFFTTKPTLRTGLGLFVCQTIVQGLGGRITVASELGRGTTFRIELPSNTSAVLPVARDQSGRAHILIVDDEPLVCSSLQRSLKRDYEVTAVQSARTALDLISKGEPFDLVLCDLMMPEMSGMDLYEELHQRFPAQCAKLIFFTGGASSTGAREFLERVPNPRLEKPADIGRIRELLRERIAS